MSTDAFEDTLLVQATTCPTCLPAVDFDGSTLVLVLRCRHIHGASCVPGWDEETDKIECSVCNEITDGKDLRFLFPDMYFVEDPDEKRKKRVLVRQCEAGPFLKYADADTLDVYHAEHAKFRTRLYQKSIVKGLLYDFCEQVEDSTDVETEVETDAEAF